MAQVVIFAPEGEDVSVGEQALKDAGHDVEVVEATAENLLHMAIGMIEHHKEKKDEEEKEAPAEEEPTAEEPSEEPPAEEPAEEDPLKQESLGKCLIDDDNIEVVRGKVTRLFVSEMQRGEKTTFRLNESIASTWGKSYSFFLTTPSGHVDGMEVPVYKSKFGKTYLEVSDADARFF